VEGETSVSQTARSFFGSGVHERLVTQTKALLIAYTSPTVSTSQSNVISRA
jgi:hypothetical protein